MIETVPLNRVYVLVFVEHGHPAQRAPAAPVPGTDVRRKPVATGTTNEYHHAA
ncbi:MULTISPECIES: hypothetical protein [unclassified Nonomuraea]|uniref:hypothetical protein n=1 Tax=unclassified Nonomuraea TaxID=2593643 RepID=UPI0035C14035